MKKSQKFPMPLKNQGVFRAPVQEHSPVASLGHPADYASSAEINHERIIRLCRLKVHAVAVLKQLGDPDPVLQIA